ncbi:21550_t:CDS:2, partial [Entrophospora sp. SA101]
NMIEKDPGCMSTNLYNLVNDRNFWANVECLTYVSSPAKKAVKCIESANSTLADFFLILIQMAATIKQLPISDSTEHKGFQRQFFHSVIRTALEVWKNLGGGDKSAQYTLAIVPHSASCECLFSVLSWFTQKCRNRLDVEKVSNMAKLHSFYTMNANSELNYITQEMSEEQLINALHDYGNGLFSGEGERENFNRPLEDIEDYASKFDLSLQEAQEIPANTDFSLFSQENSSIVDLPLSSPELSDDDEIIDLGTLEYDNEIANVNFFEDNNAAAEGTANIMDFFKL